MKSIFGINAFVKIFSNEKYREKLDNIILSFFGLESNIKIKKSKNNYEESNLEFIVFLNKIFLLKIVVKDTQKLFKFSKKFYINFSYKKCKKNYVLLYPCYWEIYYNTCLKNNDRKKELETFAALFGTNTKKEVKMLLKELKIFNNDEINDIMNMIEE